VVETTSLQSRFCADFLFAIGRCISALLVKLAIPDKHFGNLVQAIQSNVCRLIFFDGG
jgi:hypothetical protein